VKNSNIFENNPHGIIRKSALVFLNNIAGLFLGYVSFLIIARNMGKEVLGIIGFALGFIGLFFSLGDLNLSAAHIKRISEGKDLGKCIGTYLFLKIILIVIMVVTVQFGIVIWEKIEKLKLIIPTQKAILQIILVYFTVRLISSVIEVTFLARKEIGKAAISIFTLNSVRCLATILVVLLGCGVLAIAGTYVLAAVVSLLIGLCLFRGYPISKPNFSYLKNYWHFSAPLAISSILFMVDTNLPLILIYFFWSAGETGLFFAAVRVVLPIFALGRAIHILIFPTISSLYSQGRIDSIRRLSRQAERLISLISSPLVIFIIFFSQPIIIFLLGENFLPISSMLKILVLDAFLYIITVPYFLQFRGTEHTKTDMKINVVKSIVLITLNLIFIPASLAGYKLLGLKSLGASLSILVTSLFGFLITLILVRRLTKTRTAGKFLIHLIASSFSFGVIYLITKNLRYNVFIYLLVSGSLGLLLYLFLLFIIKELRKEDIMLLRQALNPRAMSAYLRSEIGGQKLDGF